MRKLKFVSNKKYGISILTFALLITQAGITGFGWDIKEKIIRIPTPNPFLKYIGDSEKQVIKEIEVKQESTRFKVTAYDLSVASCGKSRSNPAFGISRGGTHLRDKTWDQARMIAVDPRIIPLGTSVLIEFEDDKYKIYSGIYLAGDTGSAIKNKKLDLFLGDFNSSKENKAVSEFGITYAYVTIIQ